jgi:hypothetical protein
MPNEVATCQHNILYQEISNEPICVLVCIKVLRKKGLFTKITNHNMMFI